MSRSSDSGSAIEIQSQRKRIAELEAEVVRLSARPSEIEFATEAILRTFPDLQFWLEADGTILDFHAGRANLLYVQPQDFLGKRMQEVLPADIGKRFDEAIRRARDCEDVIALKYALHVPEGKRHFEARIVVADSNRLVCFVRDITDSEALAELQAKQAGLLASIHDAVISADMEGIVRSWNPAAERIYGYSAEEAIGQHIEILYFPEGKADARERIYTPLLKHDRHQVVLRRRSKLGREIYVDLRLTLQRDENGEPTAVVGCSNDITLRVQAEKKLREANKELSSLVEKRTEALEESELRFGSVFEQAAIGIGVLETKTGRFVRANQMYCDLIGYPQEEMTRITFQQVTHPDDLQEDLDNMERLVNGEIREFTMEKRYFRKDGSLVWVNLTVSPLWKSGEDQKYHIAIIEDISVRKQAEAELQTEQKLLRRLIDLQEQERRMVAHDIHDGFVQDVVGSHFRVQSIHSGMGQTESPLARSLAC